MAFKTAYWENVLFVFFFTKSEDFENIDIHFHCALKFLNFRKLTRMSINTHVKNRYLVYILFHKNKKLIKVQIELIKLIFKIILF